MSKFWQQFHCVLGVQSLQNFRSIARIFPEGSIYSRSVSTWFMIPDGYSRQKDPLVHESAREFTLSFYIDTRNIEFLNQFYWPRRNLSILRRATFRKFRVSLVTLTLTFNLSQRDTVVDDCQPLLTYQISSALLNPCLRKQTICWFSQIA